MVLFNYSTKELTAKVVYYGAGLCGKTTNLQWIHEKLPIKNKGKMLSLATETDRTLFFDFLPIELGSIRGMKTRIQLYTVPGQVFYNATRRMVLKGADCVVFVCDSQEAMLDANLESFENLRQNLEANEIDADEIPMVIQYNKRDLPNALPVEILNEKLNPRGLPFYEAVAVKGQGVEETLKGVTATVFRSLATKYGGASAAPAAAAPPAPRSAPMAPAPVAAAPVAAAPKATTPAPAAPRPAPPRAAPMAAAAVAAAPMAGASADALLDSLEIVAPPEAMPEAGVEELSMPVGGDAEEIELEELAPEPYTASPGRAPARSAEPELSLEAIDEEVVDEDELGPAPSFGALDEEPPARELSLDRGALSTAPVSVELSATSGPTDIAIPVEVNLRNGAARVQLHIRLTLNLNLRR
jgi:signal recognition particle receptor subunit beta